MRFIAETVGGQLGLLELHDSGFRVHWIEKGGNSERRRKNEIKISWSYGCAEVNSNADAALRSPHFPGFHVQRAIGLACLAWRVGDYFWAPIR